MEACDNHSFCNTTNSLVFTIANFITTGNFSAPSGFLNRIYTIEADVINTTTSATVILELSGPNLALTNFTMVQVSNNHWVYNYTPENVGIFSARIYAYAAFVSDNHLTGSFTTQVAPYEGAGRDIIQAGGGGAIPLFAPCGDNVCQVDKESYLICPLDCPISGIDIYPALLMFRLEKPVDTGYVVIKNNNNQTTYFTVRVICNSDVTDRACDWITLNQTGTFSLAPRGISQIKVSTAVPAGLNLSRVYSASIDIQVSGVDAGKQVQVLFASDSEITRRSIASITGAAIQIGNYKTDVASVAMVSAIGAGMVIIVVAFSMYLRPAKPKHKHFA